VFTAIKRLPVSNAAMHEIQLLVGTQQLEANAVTVIDLGHVRHEKPIVCHKWSHTSLHRTEYFLPSLCPW